MGSYVVWKEEGVLIKFSGSLKFRDLFNTNISIYQDARNRKMNFQLWDFEDVQEADLDIIMSRSIAIIDKAAMTFYPEVKVAMVTTNDSILKFIHNFKKCIAGSQWQCEIFESRELAQRWVSSKVLV